MMGPVGLVVLLLALAGVAASWGIGAVYFARTLEEIEGAKPSGLGWLAVLAWPAALGRVRGAAVGRPDIVNKAVVALIICVILAAATISLSTNFNRVSG